MKFGLNIKNKGHNCRINFINVAIELPLKIFDPMQKEGNHVYAEDLQHRFRTCFHSLLLIYFLVLFSGLERGTKGTSLYCAHR